MPCPPPRLWYTGAVPRPKSFDPDTALDRAMDVFRVKGYSGASIAELTAAMGINRFSLYDTFGDKHTLYMSTIDRYERTTIDPLIENLDAVGSTAQLERYFDALAEHVVSSDSSPCCLLHRTACADASGDAQACARVVEIRDRVVGAYRAVAERLAARDDIPRDTDPEHAAWALFTLHSGIVTYATAPPPLGTIGAAVRLVISSMREHTPAASVL